MPTVSQGATMPTVKPTQTWLSWNRDRTVSGVGKISRPKNGSPQDVSDKEAKWLIDNGFARPIAKDGGHQFVTKRA